MLSITYITHMYFTYTHIHSLSWYDKPQLTVSFYFRISQKVWQIGMTREPSVLEVKAFGTRIAGQSR